MNDAASNVEICIGLLTTVNHAQSRFNSLMDGDKFRWVLARAANARTGT